MTDTARTPILPFGATAAIFDFDGTIADTAAVWNEVDEIFLARRGHETPADYSARLSALGFVEGARYTIERFGLCDSVAEVCDEWTALSLELFKTEVTLRPGVEAYLRDLREAGVPVALATTNNHTLLSSVKSVDVCSLFDVCVFGPDVNRGKDFPDIYLETARRLGVKPSTCVVFEDLPAAVLSAKAAGMRCVGVLSQDPLQQAELLREVADDVIADWTGLAQAR